MSGLRDAIALQQKAASELGQCRSNTAAWSDEQRQRLDRECLDPLAQRGQQMLERLRDAAREIAEAQRMLPR
jgi:hypothetical protein